MRILKVVHQSLPRWVGGTELYVHQLARALVSRGHSVEVFVQEAGDGLKQDVFEEITYHRLGVRLRTASGVLLATFGAPETERAFAKVLMQVRPEIVHFHHLLGLPANLFWQVVRAGLPAVITLHDYWFVCANTKLLTNDTGKLCAGPQAWINCARCGLARLEARWALPGAPLFALPFAVRDLVLRRILHRADRLVAPSRFLRDIYLALGAPSDRMSVVETGIQSPLLTTLPRQPHVGLRVVYAGALAKLKGVHVLIKAFETLSATAELWIAGDPGREPDYAQQLQKGRHPGLRFLGQLNRTELWAHLAAADIIAVPSLWYENSPLVILEARAVRRPVIASRLGALTEMVRDGIDGVLVPPGDAEAWGHALQLLAEQPAEIARLRANILPVRTHEQMADDMEEIYVALLKPAR